MQPVTAPKNCLSGRIIQFILSNLHKHLVCVRARDVHCRTGSGLVPGMQGSVLDVLRTLREN